MDGSLPPPEAALPMRELEARITRLAGHLNAAQHQWLALIAEFDRREGWVDWATHSCAHWLNWKCGIDLGAAREKVRVAHALEALPRISAAMARGELSYSKVRALTRVADAGTEEALLSIARYGTAHHVEKLVRGFRRAKEAAELTRAASQQATRSLHWHTDHDGSLVIKVRLPAETGAVFIKAIEGAREALPRPDVSAETFPSNSQRFAAERADALGAVAESYLVHGAAALPGGDRQQVVVHVDLDTLRDEAAGRSELEDGPALPAATLRRLACDASVVSIIEDAGGEPLSVGRKTRSIPPALRRALNARDRGCRFPGCSHTRYVDGHHIHHWANGGETKLGNLVLLCRFHHRLVHEGRVQVQVLDDGGFRFLRADGVVIDGATRPGPQPVSWCNLVDANALAGLCIDEETAVTSWRGESMDYGYAVQSLLQRMDRGGDVSAETRVRR